MKCIAGISKKYMRSNCTPESNIAFHFEAARHNHDFSGMMDNDERAARHREANYTENFDINEEFDPTK